MYFTSVLALGAAGEMISPHADTAWAQGTSASQNATKPPTKLPSKTKLQMSLSAKPAPEAVNAKLRATKPRAAAQWSKSSATKATPNKPQATAPTAPKAVAAKPAGAKPVASRPAAASPAAARPAAAKPAAAKPAAPAPVATKKAASKKPKAAATNETKPVLNSQPPPTLSTLVGGGIAKFFFVAIGLAVLLSIVNVVAYQKLYTLAGHSGWHVWVPIYNLVVHLKIAGLPAWAILGYLIPYVGAFMPLFTSYRFAKAFGKSHLYCMLFAVFNPIMTAHLAFSGATLYVGHHPNGYDPGTGQGAGHTGHSMGHSMAQSLMQRGAGSAALQGTNGNLSFPQSRFGRRA